VGMACMEKIFSERENGPFAGLSDFCERVRVQKRQLENLILCGAFDRLEANRRRLFLRTRSELPAEEVEDFSPAEKARFELSLTGLTFSGHPIAFLREQLSRRGVIKSGGLERCKDGERITVAGLKVVLHTPPTRSGLRVVFLTLEDEDGLTDVTVFSDIQQRYAKTIFGRNVLMVEGRLQRMHPRSVTLVAHKILPISLAAPK
jgi:error-prone DNA polymerase